MHLSFKVLWVVLFLGPLMGCEMLQPRIRGDDVRVRPLGDKGIQSTPEAEEVYNVLVAEVAAQRGDLEAAFVHYLAVARAGGNVYAVQQATRIGMHLEDAERTREALELWLELAPNDVSVHQVAVLYYASRSDLDQAVDQLDQLIRLTGDIAHSAFLQAAAVVSAVKEVEIRLELMQRLVDRHAEKAEAHYAFALVAAGAERPDLAEREAGLAAQLRPKWVSAQVLLSKILLARGDVPGARRILERALAKSAADVDLRSAYARLLVDVEELETAFRQFEQVLAREPENADALYALGLLGLQLGRDDESRRYFERLYRLGKKADEVAFYLGQVAEHQGDYGAAEGWYQKSQGSYRIEAQVRLARVLAVHRGDLSRARDMLQQLRVQYPLHGIELFSAEGEILRVTGHFGDALKVYGKALEAYPGNTKLLYARALVAAEAGNVDLLEQDLRKVLEREPNNADALNALGYTLADQTSRYEEAEGYIRRALELKPDNPAVLDSMGWVRYRLGDSEGALVYLRKAYANFPDAEIAAHLGEVLWVTGDKKEARRIWNEALEKDPKNRYLKRVMKRFR